MKVDLNGKVALVTGSAHRVGRAIALELAHSGCNLVIHYNDSADKAKATAEDIRALGVDVLTFRANLGKPAEIDTLFAAIKSRFGRLDVLVNSAAIFEQGDLSTLSLEDWRRSLDINLTAPFLCTQHAARLMREMKHGGVIVNISDMAGLKGSVNYPQHSVAKAGLLMFTRIAARTFAPDIRVNAIVPGLIMQPPDMADEVWERLVHKMPLKRPGSAQDAARAVLYLVTEDYLTGTVITLDGGEALL